MYPAIEPVEARRLFSQSLPVGAQLVWDQQPSDVAAGQKMPAVTVLLEDSSGHPITVDAAAVQLRIGAGPAAGHAIRTVSLSHGMATFRNLSFRKSGPYELAASIRGRALVSSSGFNVTPGIAAKMDIGHFSAGFAQLGLASIGVEIRDRFGNLATNDTSVLSLGRVTGSNVFFTTFDVTGTNYVNSNGMTVGVSFVAGEANFDLVATGGPGKVFVQFVDSNKKVPPLTSPRWEAHL